MRPQKCWASLIRTEFSEVEAQSMAVEGGVDGALCPSPHFHLKTSAGDAALRPAPGGVMHTCPGGRGTCETAGGYSGSV